MESFHENSNFISFKLIFYILTYLFLFFVPYLYDILQLI